MASHSCVFIIHQHCVSSFKYNQSGRLAKEAFSFLYLSLLFVFFTCSECYGENDKAVLKEFKKRCTLLKESGTLVLRGMTAIDQMENLTINHLKPIPPSVWRTLKWNKDGQPPVGVYSVPNNSYDEQDTERQSAVLNFCVNFC